MHVYVCALDADSILNLYPRQRPAPDTLTDRASALHKSTPVRSRHDPRRVIVKTRTKSSGARAVSRCRGRTAHTFSIHTESETTLLLLVHINHYTRNVLRYLLLNRHTGLKLLHARLLYNASEDALSVVLPDSGEIRDAFQKVGSGGLVVASHFAISCVKSEFRPHGRWDTFLFTLRLWPPALYS